MNGRWSYRQQQIMTKSYMAIGLVSYWYMTNNINGNYDSFKQKSILNSWVGGGMVFFSEKKKLFCHQILKKKLIDLKDATNK